MEEPSATPTSDCRGRALRRPPRGGRPLLLCAQGPPSSISTSTPSITRTSMRIPVVGDCLVAGRHPRTPRRPQTAPLERTLRRMAGPARRMGEQPITWTPGRGDDDQTAGSHQPWTKSRKAGHPDHEWASTRCGPQLPTASRNLRTLLPSGGLGTMGPYSFPAAIGAQFALSQQARHRRVRRRLVSR